MVGRWTAAPGCWSSRAGDGLQSWMQHLTSKEGLQRPGSMPNWSPRLSSHGHGSHSALDCTENTVLLWCCGCQSEGKLHEAQSGTRIDSHGPGISGSPNVEAWVAMSKSTCLCQQSNPVTHVIFDDSRLSWGGGGTQKKPLVGGDY